MLSCAPLAQHVPGAFTNMQENAPKYKIKVKNKIVEKLDKHNNGVLCDIPMPAYVL